MSNRRKIKSKAKAKRRPTKVDLMVVRRAEINDALGELRKAHTTMSALFMARKSDLLSEFYETFGARGPAVRAAAREWSFSQTGLAREDDTGLAESVARMPDVSLARVKLPSFRNLSRQDSDLE